MFKIRKTNSNSPRHIQWRKAPMTMRSVGIDLEQQPIPGGDVTTWLNAQHLRRHNKTTLNVNLFSLFRTSSIYSTFAVWSRTASGSDVTQWMSWHWHCGIICSVVCFFLLTHPSQYGCISQARKLILDAFFGNKRVMAHIGEAQKQKQNE